ncbi:hypothetical protein [uncultured phage_MedDCM-OCT-S31-C1]|uniref:Uncharacterized protein n=1 Tax=uncultured phage_MedDCM-OCT-S31-C1 TaxID=2740800 RepID=A0A6S4P8M0_9CAUD|nr:hypothetical protein HOQ55_gp07 [uncultured phage_MedDCM-OCT-S31-C1]BAQ94389.1 hypothetical protein [uncultured phage_MedDCM-OCT-S31-C1]
MFSFHVETAKRALNACNDITEMRMISVKMLEMMVHQRKVTRDLVDQAIKAEGSQSQLPPSP